MARSSDKGSGGWWKALAGALLVAGLSLALFRKEPASPPEACRLSLQARLPFESHEFDMTVPVTLNGAQTQFVFDLGTSDTYVLREGRAKFALQDVLAEHWRVGEIEGSRSQSEFVGVQSLRFAGVEFGPRPMPVSDLGYAADSEARSVETGQMGTDLLAGFELDLDIPNKTLAVYRARPDCPDARPDWDFSYSAVPLQRDASGRPFVPVGVNGRTILMLFATGMERTYIRDPAPDPEGNFVGLDLMTPADAGTRPLRELDTLRIGELTETRVPVRLAAQNDFSAGHAYLGIDVIRRQRFWVSLRGGRLFVADGRASAH